MATTSQLAFFPSQPDRTNLFASTPIAVIYRHWDGYPEGVLPDLIPFLKFFHASRGMSDMAYCAARTLAYLIQQYDNACRPTATPPLDPQFGGTTGYGLDGLDFGEEDYLYVIYPGGVDVYSGGKFVQTVEVK